MRPEKIQILLLLLFSMPAWASDNDALLDHENVSWTRLVYEATAFFVTLDTEIKLSTLDRDISSDQLVMKDETNLLFPEGDKIFRLDTFADGFGKKTRYTLWLDQDGEILQRKKVQRGKKNEIKIYRFSPCAYYSLRKKFSNKKFDENFNRWQASDKKFTEFDPDLCDGSPIYDVNSLLYLISALDIRDVGFEKEVLTFSRGNLIKVKIVAKKKTDIYAEFKIKSPSANEEIEDDIDVLQVQLIPQVGSKKERDKFKFLGLKGKVKLYVDTKRKLILRLSGKVKVVGSIDINLKKAELVR